MRLIEELMRKIGELGLLGISVPEEYGGMGMGFVTTMLVCDYISGATGFFSNSFRCTYPELVAMPITLYGTEEQKQKYLPKLATGEWFASYCLTEPEAGSDADSWEKQKLSYLKMVKEYIITGQKMWITNAGFADLFIVFARIDEDKNITGFIVEKDKAGAGFYFR